MSAVVSPFQLPGYLDALERESVGRVIAFHGLRERIGEFELLPMTLRHYSILRLVDSPFLPPFATPSTQQLIQFLWIMNPHFSAVENPERALFFEQARESFIPPPPPRWKNRLFLTRWYYRRKGCELREAEAVADARKFAESAFADREISASGGMPSYYSDECFIVGAIARDCGWSREAIMNLSLSEIFQHLKRIRETMCLEDGRPVLMSNPSEDVIQRHLADVNKN